MLTASAGPTVSLRPCAETVTSRLVLTAADWIANITVADPKEPPDHRSFFQGVERDSAVQATAACRDWCHTFERTFGVVMRHVGLMAGPDTAAADPAFQGATLPPPTRYRSADVPMDLFAQLDRVAHRHAGDTEIETFTYEFCLAGSAPSSILVVDQPDPFAPPPRGYPEDLARVVANIRAILAPLMLGMTHAWTLRTIHPPTAHQRAAAQRGNPWR